MIIGTTVAIIVIAAIALAAATEHNRRRKRAAFGPEYEALVRQEGSPRAADRELTRRHRAYAKLTLRPLTPQEHSRYAQDRRQVQESFVDDPKAALDTAEALVIRLARNRGYPGGDGEALLELLSIPHTSAVSGYRHASQVRETAAREEAGHATTEDMRQAFQEYAALFDEMLAEAGQNDDAGSTQNSSSRNTTILEAGR